MSPGGQPLASFGDRLLAYLIDTAIFLFASLLVMVPVVLVFVYAVIIPSVDAGAGEPPPVSVLLWVVGMQAVIMALSLAMGYVYYVEIMLRRNGQTVGKKVMKLRTIPIDPAAVLTRPMAGRRYLAQFVGGTFIPAFSYIDGLWQLWDKPYQQCLHDKFASTVVVKVVAQ